MTSFLDFQRKNVNDIKFKDIKCVQFQLEDILVCATKRKKQLEETISNLETISAKRNKRTKVNISNFLLNISNFAFNMQQQNLVISWQTEHFCVRNSRAISI